MAILEVEPVGSVLNNGIATQAKENRHLPAKATFIHKISSN